MPKQNVIQSNFTTGEVSPLVRGRQDSKLYAGGLETCENFIIRPQGPLFRRSGTKAIRSVRFGATAGAILVPFEFSDLSAYVCEFGATYIHFYKDGKPLFETSSDADVESFTTASNGGLMQLVVGSYSDLPWINSIHTFAGATVTNNGSGKVRATMTQPHTLRVGQKIYFQGGIIGAVASTVTAVISNYAFDTNDNYPGAGSTNIFSHGLMAGDMFYIQGAANYPTLSNQYHTVKSVEDYLTWTIANVSNVNNGSPTAEDAHTIPLEIATTYTEAQLAELKFVQSADVLYIFHPDHPTRKLTRLDSEGERADWYLSDVDWKDGPYLPNGSTAPAIDTVTPANGYIHSDVYLEVSAYTHTATVTAAAAFTIRTITGASNNGVGLIRITSASHGYATGDSIYITGVLGTTEANGTWTITSITANTYDLQSSTFANAYTSGGTSICRDYIEYKEGESWRLARIKSASSPTTQAVVDIIDNILAGLDEGVKLKSSNKRVVSDTPANAGSARPSGPEGSITNPRPGQLYFQKTIDHNADLTSSIGVVLNVVTTGVVTSTFSNTFSRTDVGKYVRIRSSAGTAPGYWAQITKLNGATGTAANHADSVPMHGNSTPVATTGNFIVTGETRTCTITSKKAGAVFAMFASTDVGRHIRLGFAGKWTWGKITGYTSTSVVSVTLYQDMPRDPSDGSKIAGNQGGTATTGITYDWRLGAWSATTGYPSCGTFHEQRLFVGRSDTEPQTFWGSISADFENMSPTEPDGTVLDDSAITFTIASTKVNPIKWMESGPTMTIGTSGGEWQVKAGSAVSEPITPSNISVTPHTSHGSAARPRPTRVGSSIIFADRPGKRVRELSYSYQDDGLVSRDTTHISEHILRDGGGVIETAYQQEPNNILWFLLTDGTLAAMTWNKEQEVAAWHRHIIAGGGADAVVESIACVPSADSSRDDFYLIVKRTINGATQRWVEMLESDFYPASVSTKTGMRFLDGGRLIEDFTGTAITGLTHLEGKTVRALGNGANLGTFTVSSGSITLLAAYDEVWVGLDYTSLAKSLPPEAASAFGTSHGQIKQVKKMQARILSSLDFEYGWSGATLNSKTALELNKGQSSNFVTDTVELIPNAPYNPESQWTIQTSKPYPLNVLSVSLTVECGE